MPKTIEFRDLREEQCKLLYAIWQIQTKRPHLGATAARIRALAGFGESEFNRSLHGLRSISKSFYVLTVKGRRPVRYRLATEHLVTQSDTSAILLGYLRYPEKYRKDGQIPYKGFVEWVGKALLLPEGIVRNRLEKAVKKLYLTEIEREELYLELGHRLICEKRFLEFLASHFRPNVPELGKESATQGSAG